MLGAMGVLWRWAPIALVLVAVVGCARGPYLWVYDLPEPVLTGVSADVAPGDTLYVFVRNQPTMTAEVTVAQDLTIALPVVGQVSVARCSVDRVAPRVQAGLSGVLDSPDVRVSLVSRRPARVTVIGEVRNPGAFELKEGSRVVDAVASAGGLTEFARRQRLFVVRQGVQSMRVRFRFDELARGETASSRFLLLDGDVVVAE